jgi:hypothetical protein
MSDFESCVLGTSWKLRAGQPVPICDDCPCSMVRGSITYKLQSFGGEIREVRNYKATTSLLESEDFIGLNPEALYENAQYNATQFISSDGEIVFAGQERKLPTYVNEDDIPGVKDFMFDTE